MLDRKMSLSSHIITDPILIQTAKEIWQFADDVAAKTEFVTNDLILAAVWYCMSLSKLPDNIVDGTPSTNAGASKTEVLAKTDVTPSKKKETSNSLKGASNEPVSGWVLEHVNINSRKRTGGTEASIVIDAQTVSKANSCTADDTSRNADKVVSANTSKSRTKMVSLLGKDTTRTPQSVVLISNKSSRTIKTPEAAISKSKISNKTTPTVSSVRQNFTSALNSAKVKQKNSNKIDDDVEVINLDDDEDDDTENDKVSETEETQSEDMPEKKSCVEKSSADENKVGKIPNVESDENTNAGQTSNICSKVKQEEEPDYFDMDCEEIEDDNDYEEMIDENVKEIVISGALSDKDKSSEVDDAKSKEASADVTIISDDEDEDVKDLAQDKTEKFSNKDAKISSELRVTENESGSGRRLRSARRKQSIKDAAEDLPDKTVNTGKNPSKKSQDEGEISHKKSVSAFTGPELDDSSSSRSPAPVNDGVSDKTSNAENSAVAVLGLVPVQHVQTLGIEAAHAESQSSNSLFATLGSTIYVASGMSQGSIPSLVPFKDTQPFQCGTSSAGSLDALYDSSNQDSQSSVNSLVGYEPMEDNNKQQSTGVSPPKKKRLLDFDKKWHMQPKYSPSQDKYLALPGGIEANSVSLDESLDEKGSSKARLHVADTDWRIPGKYTSISYSHTVPNIEVERDDTDFSHSHLMLFETDSPSYGDSDVENSENEYDKNSDLEESVQKSAHDKRRGRGRPRGRPRGRAGVSRPAPGASAGRGTRKFKPAAWVRKAFSGRSPAKLTEGSRDSESSESSPSRFHALGRAAGLSARGRAKKIGFYSVKRGMKSRGTAEGARRRGTSVLRARTTGRGRGSQASTDRTNLRGNTRGRGQTTKRGHRGKKRGPKPKNVIVID